MEFLDTEAYFFSEDEWIFKQSVFIHNDNGEDIGPQKMHRERINATEKQRLYYVLLYLVFFSDRIKMLVLYLYLGGRNV